MTISFEIPPDLERDLQGLFHNLGQTAKEAFIIQGYADRKFGIGVVRRLLGMETRWEAEKWLTEHHVPMNYSADDLEEDRRTLHQVFGHDA